MKIELKD